MKHPSIRFRLMLGTGLLVAAVLIIANVGIYHAFEKTLMREIDEQLLQSASLLGKSVELEANSLDYEWQDAMSSATPGSPEITGIFQFYDVNRKSVTKSPDLGEGELPIFSGHLNQPVLREIVLKDGRHAKAVGLLHYPFIDDVAIAEAAKSGKVLRPEEHPQILVCARETESITNRLSDLKEHLGRAALGTILAIWAAIFAISTWCLRPIREFSINLLERSENENPPQTEIPRDLPSELVGLAGTFNTTLERVERSRAREKEFALHAAHELRTPVAGILATLEQALHRPRDSQDLSGRISEALKITNGMRITLNSLMRLARLRGGLERSAKTSFDPARIISEIITQLTPLIELRALTLDTRFPKSALILVNDPGLFRALVSNLIENAVRHSPKNSVVIISLIDSVDRLVFETRNPCRNLHEKDIDRLFQPFQRGSDDADQEGGHAGLGLSLAREAAHLLGGRVYAEIEKDGSVAFIATLLR